MARARNLKPGFFANEDLAECSFAARLCFAGLWTLADREGRLEDRPKRIKGELFRFDSIEVEPLLGELVAHGFLVRYQNSDGSFIQVSKFSVHQTPHYSEKPSVIKPPEFQESQLDDDDAKPGALQESGGHEDIIKPGTLQENSRITPGVDPPLRGGRNPLNPSLLNPDSGFLNPDSPTAEKDSGAKAPAPASPSPLPLPPESAEETAPMTAKERVWAIGVGVFGSDPAARRRIGKLAGTYGDEVLAEALATAVVEKPNEPMSWVTATCEAAKLHRRVNGGHQVDPGDTLADPKPAWAIKAGFPDRFMAENAGCRAGNAAKYREGKRVQL